MIKVNDYPNLNAKIEEFGLIFPESLAILPDNLANAKSKNELVNAQTTSTVRVLFRNAGIVETPIEKDKEIPERILESFDWVGPTIFIASALISQNPEIVDKTLGTILEYLQDFFKGIPKQERNAKLHIVTTTRKGDYKLVDYEGPENGLKELPEVIRSLRDER